MTVIVPILVIAILALFGWRAFVSIRWIFGKKTTKEATLTKKRSQYVGDENRIRIIYTDNCLYREYYVRGIAARQPRFTFFYGTFIDEDGEETELQLPWKIYETVREGERVSITYVRKLLIDAQGFFEARQVRRRRITWAVLGVALSIAILAAGIWGIQQQEQQKEALREGIDAVEIAAADAGEIPAADAKELLTAMGLYRGSEDARIKSIVYREGTLYGEEIRIEMQLPREALEGFLDAREEAFTEFDTPYNSLISSAHESICDTATAQDRLFFQKDTTDVTGVPSPVQIVVYGGGGEDVTIGVEYGIVSREMEEAYVRLCEKKE